ncbi:MAG TPA: hypothetical protein VFS02_17430, partial [Telluria sp.]|nr:hypothetical protein [Telluria sp.]
SGRLHPASASASLAHKPLPGKAFLQRSSAYRATLSMVAAPDPVPGFCDPSGPRKSVYPKNRACVDEFRKNYVFSQSFQ